MVKMGEVSGVTSVEEAINSFNHHFAQYKNFRAVQIDSSYKVYITKRNGETVSKVVPAGSIEDAKRIVLRRNKGATGMSARLWRKRYLVYADPK